MGISIEIHATRINISREACRKTRTPYRMHLSHFPRIPTWLDDVARTAAGELFSFSSSIDYRFAWFPANICQSFSIDELHPVIQHVYVIEWK